MTNDWTLGMHVRYQPDGITGVIVDVTEGAETCLCMRYETEDGQKRELVAATSEFEVVA